MKLDAASWRALQICIVYGLTSVAISLIYKGVLSGWHYEAKFILLATQLILSLLFCSFAKRFLKHVPGLEVPEFSPAIFKQSIVPSILFVANVVIGWYGLQLVNVPMFLCIRRTNAAFTLVAEYLILRKVASPRVALAVAFIVLGAIVAGYETLQANALGYLYTLGNNFFTAWSMSLTKKFSDQTKTQGFGIVYYNAIVALPLCVVGAVVTGEVGYTLFDFPAARSLSFWSSLLGASSLGVFMSYIVFLCTTANSPLATSITGNLKDVVSTLLGATLFGDFLATTYTVSGLLLSFFGAGLFSVAKLQETRTAQQVLPTADTARRGAASDGKAASPTALQDIRVQDGEDTGAGALPARPDADVAEDSQETPMLDKQPGDAHAVRRGGMQRAHA